VQRRAPLVTFPAGIDRDVFLRDYWQKRPLVMRSALPKSGFALTPDELAGLACEAEFESRIVIARDERSWKLHQGPFDDHDFAALPRSHWTLLVQDVDKYLPAVADLIDAFDFVPGWRVDDIMISYAVDQGGVGPHSDAYDVFLMQARGTRRWRLSYSDFTDADLLPDLDLRILAHFSTDEDWLLGPGDVLYLPPGIAHWGVAQGECMTYSLGFRSPSQQDLAADWFQHLVSLASAQRLDDPPDLDNDNLAELTPGLYRAAERLLRDLPTTSSDEFRDWLGRYLTEPKPQFHIPPPEESWTADRLGAWLKRDRRLCRHPFARVAWAELDRHIPALFVQGESLILPPALRDIVRHIAAHRRLEPSVLLSLCTGSADAMALVLRLVNQGVLGPEVESR
jgi:50S ribosomal protein L16 3-hydroxylase